MHSAANLADVAFGLLAQICQLLYGISAYAQKIQNFLVILLQIQNDLPQILPLRQIVHPKYTVSQKIVKVSATNLLESRATHAVRYKVAAIRKNRFNKHIALRNLIATLFSHPTFFFSIIPLNNILKFCRCSSR